MEIQPQGNIILYSGIPLDNTFDHTIYFRTRADQEYYFNSISGDYKVVFQNQYYSRKGRGVLRIEKNVEYLFNYNYMRFQNNGYFPQVEPPEIQRTAKWFYCFITAVEYVNDAVTDVFFEIDPIQTWLFDCELEDCFVEREHSETDEIGENTVPEPVDVGEYAVQHTDILRYTVQDGQAPPTTIPLLSGKYSVVIAAPWKITRMPYPGHHVTEFDDAGANFYGNQFSGLYYTAFDLSSTETDPESGLTPAEQLVYVLTWGDSTLQQRLEEIVAIYIVPTSLVTTPSTTPSAGVRIQLANIQKYTNWQYYNGTSLQQPKNKKLYAAPYNVLHMVSSDGDYIDYQYERFAGNVCNFQLQGVMGCPPQIQLVPMDYKKPANESATDLLNFNETLILNNFGLCPWVTDTFRAWLAQNSSRLITKTVTGIASAASGLVAGANLTSLASGAATAFARGSLSKQANQTKEQSIIGLADNIMGSLSEIHSASKMPDATHGVSQGFIGASNGELGYRFYALRIKDEYAVLVDDFFNRFGYATKRTKKPNISARPYWNYIQTKGCTITGKVPAEAASAICNIFNNGVTFWRYERNRELKVGDYTTQDNSPDVQQNNQQVVTNNG